MLVIKHFPDINIVEMDTIHYYNRRENLLFHLRALCFAESINGPWRAVERSPPHKTPLKFARE